MNYKSPRRPQFFYTTAPLPCPYVAGRTERKVVTEITGPDAETVHDRLSRAGFRRSHNIAYAPVCPSCHACVPIRIPVASFQPDRTLRKIHKANAGLEGYEVPARATAEQFQLFQAYQKIRHGDGDMASMSFYDYRAMVEDTPIETFIGEFRDADDRLISACLTDRLGDGLSAVYSFFLPGLERRSLGTYAILWLIERARGLGIALRVSWLLGRGKSENGLQGAVPAQRNPDGRVLAGAYRGRDHRLYGRRGSYAGDCRLSTGKARGSAPCFSGGDPAYGLPLEPFTYEVLAAQVPTLKSHLGFKGCSTLAASVVARIL